MENLIFLVHVLTALAIIALILLQQGKGAEMGASFGSGSSQTLFGASGSGNFFSKMTAVFAVVFFITSFSLAVIAKQSAGIGEGVSVPALIETSDDDLPALEESSVQSADDLPELAPEQSVEESANDDLPETSK